MGNLSDKIKSSLKIKSTVSTNAQAQTDYLQWHNQLQQYLATTTSNGSFTVNFGDLTEEEKYLRHPLI